MFWRGDRHRPVIEHERLAAWREHSHCVDSRPSAEVMCQRFEHVPAFCWHQSPAVRTQLISCALGRACEHLSLPCISTRPGRNSLSSRRKRHRRKGTGPAVRHRITFAKPHDHLTFWQVWQVYSSLQPTPTASCPKRSITPRDYYKPALRMIDCTSLPF